MNDNNFVTFLAGVGLTLLGVGLAIVLGIYVLSPIDLLPGPVDDVILAIAGVFGIKKISTKKKELKG